MAYCYVSESHNKEANCDFITALLLAHKKTPHIGNLVCWGAKAIDKKPTCTPACNKQGPPLPSCEPVLPPAAPFQHVFLAASRPPPFPPPGTAPDCPPPTSPYPRWVNG